MKKVAILLLAVFAVGMFLYAAELEGVTLADHATIGSAKVVLNGMGVRVKKIAFIGIKVYVAGLYLPTKASDAGQIISADEPKQIVMHFLYKNVETKKLVEGWNEGFEKNSPSQMAALKARIDTFNGYWSDMKTGDEAVLAYEPGVGTKVTIKGKEMGVIEGKDFAEALFAIWLGPNPPNEDLKKGLLGQ